MSDRNLIEGQLRMKQAEWALEEAKYLGPMQLFNAFKDWNIQSKKNNKDYSEPMERIVDNGSGLNQKDFDQAYEKVGLDSENYQNYINSDNPNDQTQSMENAKTINSNYIKYDDVATEFASAYINGGISRAIENDPAGIALMDYLDLNNPNPKLFAKECPEGVEDCDNKGDEGIEFTDFEAMEFAEKSLNEVNQEIASLEEAYRINNILPDDGELENLYTKRDSLMAANEITPTKWRSLQWLRKTADHWKKDVTTPKLLEQYAQKAFQSGMNSNPDDNPLFEEEIIGQLLDDNIFGGETPGKLHSMIWDPMIGSRIFREDFINTIKGPIGEGTDVKGLTYADLGITDDMLTGYDMNANSIMDDDEVNLIADTLLKDPSEAKKYLRRYALDHFKNNFDYGTKKNRPSVLDKVENENKKNDVVAERKKREDITPATRYVKDSL